AAVRVLREAGHDLAVVHAPAVLRLEVVSERAAGERGGRPHLFVAGRVGVVVVHAEEERVLGPPGEPEPLDAQHRIAHASITARPAAPCQGPRDRAARRSAGRPSWARCAAPGGRLPAAAAIAATTAAAAAEAAAATTTAAAAEAARALRPLLGLVHPQRAAVELRAVHLLDRGLRRLRRGHLDEPEAAGPAGLALGHQLHLDRLTELGERVAQRLLGGREGEVSHIESISHLHFSCGPGAEAPFSHLSVESRIAVRLQRTTR